jgi:catechol 2,3-dioxygenase-like lactoylglutathione lyase family enzyme
MAIEGLNHFNIIAPAELMEQVRDFYVDVLGLEEGYRPDFGVPGYWLYAGGNALVHLVDGDSTGSTSGAAGATGTGHLDHIAFTATDLDGTESCIKALGLEYKKMEYPDFHLTQLFIHDPIGLGVEMNFAT